jgi:uncharacterized membrane protein
MKITFTLAKIIAKLVLSFIAMCILAFGFVHMIS